jgi:hypothetical protein
VFPSNLIRLGCKFLQGTNVLAYYKELNLDRTIEKKFGDSENDCILLMSNTKKGEREKKTFYFSQKNSFCYKL